MNRPLLPALLLAALSSASCNCVSDHIVDFSSTPVSTIGEGSYRYGATTDGQMIWWNVSFADVEKTPIGFLAKSHRCQCRRLSGWPSARFQSTRQSPRLIASNRSSG